MSAKIDLRTADYLVLRLAGREFAIPAARVQGMMQARGMDLKHASVHGRALPVVWPHAPLRLRERPVSARSCLLLIGEPGGSPEFAFLVDSVSRVERIPIHHTRLEPANEFALAQIRLGEKWRDVLDLDKLASA